MDKKTLTTNYSTHSYLQIETKKNNEIHQKVFEELHRRSDAKRRYEVFRNAPGSFWASAGGLVWGREKGENGGEGALLCTQAIAVS